MKKYKQKLIFNNNHGFTTMELLAIVVIIGILAGVILINLAPIRERSEVNSLMRTMGTVVRAAGACDEVNYDGKQGDLICITGAYAIYPELDPKLTAKGYNYNWNGEKILIGGKEDVAAIIKCYIGSGMCERL